MIVPRLELVIVAPLSPCSPLVPTVIAVSLSIFPSAPDTITLAKLIFTGVPDVKWRFPLSKYAKIPAAVFVTVPPATLRLAPFLT